MQPPPNELSTCPLSRQDPELFDALVAAYGEIVQAAVREAVSGSGRQVFVRLRALARQAGAKDAVPQDLIAVHLSALAALVKSKPRPLVTASVRQSRLLLVKLIGELALYYRELHARCEGSQAC